ncbi:hypothetical protein CMI47_04610 [Candidatus Pacearchaeota archaeon]|jgi:hypothetical protein|nr:hypothetical protein [Candidatus Pacearchaeota archaeon]|tara:strand:- start:11595 stop:12164 length:570 start_codon:yes stop_codon:yes gene_type:complete
MSDIFEGLVAVKMPSKFDDSIRIKLEDGEWYSASQSTADSIRKGATVKIRVERRGKNVVITKVKELSPPAEGGSNASGGSRGGYQKRGGGFKPDPERENGIRYQSSRKDAIAVLTLMQDAGILKLGSKAAEKEGLLMATLDRITAGFYADIGELGAVKRYNDEADESDEFDPENEEDTGTDEDFGDEDF